MHQSFLVNFRNPAPVLYASHTPSAMSDQTLLESSSIDEQQQLTRNQREFEAACQSAQVYFKPCIYNSFKNVVPVSGHLKISTFEEVLHTLPYTEAPESIKDFLSKFSATFSDFYIRSLEQTCDAFDTLVGAKVCDAFIQSQTYEAWTDVLLDAIFERSYERMPTTVNLPNKPLKLHKILTIPQQYDGSAKDDAQTEQEITASTKKQDLHQIKLKGRTIIEAWQNSEDVAKFQLSQSFPPGWTPQTPGAFDVFHGTSAHLESEVYKDEISDSPFYALKRRANPNQMTPDTVPCIYTAFSALRCFLWAAFLAEVIQDPPPPGPARTPFLKLQKDWTTGGKVYRGVVLFHFGSSQSNAGNLSYYIIPAGLENKWFRHVNSYRGSSRSPGNLWREFRAIHQEDTAMWPDIIYGQEIASSQNQLKPFIKNFWRTVWCSEIANSELNKRHIRTYSISFEVVHKVEGTQIHTNTAERDRKGTWGRKSLRRGADKLKNLFK
jgi:hypothetical protein